MNVSLKQQEAQNKEELFSNALNFISAGVACYAFSLIDELGLLEQLLMTKGAYPDSFELYPNPLVVLTAIQTLECNNIVFFDKNVFKLTFLARIFHTE